MLYFLMFWEQWNMPTQPERVRRAGFFRWGKATLGAFGMFCHSTPKEAEHALVYCD